MKYPQLVSTRAVNAISDWLVSRLEQLGVEAPQIYTRLLLSLLQSSVQINDPIEFNSLETFIGNRKGGSIRRYLRLDPNTIKKLNAIQCLSEIVSPEQELTSIENLVDELWEKLKDIEKQLDYNDGVDDSIIIDAATNVKTKSNITTDQEASVDQTPIKGVNLCKNLNNDQASIVGDVIAKRELETDPKKRYFKAFPALSKEMEDSFRICRRNAKSLTWPVNRNNISSSSNVGSASKMSAKFGLLCDEEAAKEGLIKNNEFKTTSKNHLLDAEIVTTRMSNFPNHTIVSSTNSLKRKTKRRKSQSMSKGRLMPNMRKGGGFNDGGVNVAALGAAAGGNSRRSNRHLSPTQWDTDFDGYWEMGRDLIKEFFAKQSGNRNRCNSEGDVPHQTMESELQAKDFNFDEPKIGKNVNEQLGTLTPDFMAQVDISFCYDDNGDDEDTFKSIAELTADSSLSASRTSPRRLYQRLVLPENNVGEANNANAIVEKNDENKDNEETDLVQFEAKFNSNLAALWQDVSDDENANIDDTSSMWSAPKDIPWPTVAPIKENLKNFWSIFNNHPLDFAKILQYPDKETENVEHHNQLNNVSDVDINSCASLPSEMTTTMSNGNNANEFISMPCNMPGFDVTDCSSTSSSKHCITDDRNMPISCFLQDSIWSENINGGKNTDTDESFFLKVWNSNKKLYNLDAIYDTKLTEMNSEKANDDNANFQFSKWSEGINAGPTMLQQQQKQIKQQQTQTQQNLSSKIKNPNIGFNHNQHQNQQTISSMDCVDTSASTTNSSTSSSSFTLSSSGIFSGHTPSFQSSQQSWPIDKNAKSLTEAYGIGSPAHHENQYNAKLDEEVSQISLSNHSTESSGFVEYARLKPSTQPLGQLTIKQQQLNYQAHCVPAREPPAYGDDENLLSSQHTHFHPVKAFVDGYTFDVCSALDVINYRRSESGYLYFESQKYLEYTRNDSFMTEDESSNSSFGASTTPLYAGSNCEAAVARKRQKERKSDELVLKFRIMNREIGCQTDDEETVKNMHAAAAAQMQHPLYLVFSGASTDGVKIQTSGQACSNAIEALNKAVAAAAKASADRDRLQLDRSWIGIDEMMGTSHNALSGGTSNLWTMVQQPPRDEFGSDEIDFCNESSCTYGGMNSVDRQWQNCKLNSNVSDGLPTTADISSGGIAHGNDNNSTGVTTHNGGELHTLWGMCAACNGDFKSAPANNALRDELNMEADEIMSDLRNMQDLYIGCGGAVGADIESIGGNYNWSGAYDSYDGIKHPTAIVANSKETVKLGENDENLDWENNNNMKRRQQETQQKVLQQVNKLIANLMRPERANDTNILADTAASAHRELGESLWPDDGKHNIWKNHNEQIGNNEKDDDLLNSTTKTTTTTTTTAADQTPSSMLGTNERHFLAQLTWEHNNLAELWAKDTPPLAANTSNTTTTPLTTSLASNIPKPPNSMCSLTTTSTSTATATTTATTAPIGNVNESDHHEVDCECELIKHDESVDTDNDEIFEKNDNGCDNTSTVTSAATYKRIQQYLNSSVGAISSTSVKLKLANRKRRHSASQNYAILHNGLGNNATLYAAAAAANVAAVATTTTQKISTTNNNNNHNNNNNNNNHSNNNNNNNIANLTNLNQFNVKRNTTSNTTASTTATSTTNTEIMNPNGEQSTAAAFFSDDIDMDMESNDIIGRSYDPSAYLFFNNVGGVDNVLLPPKQTIITCKYWTTIDPIMDDDVIDCNDGDGDGTTFSCLVDKNDLLLKHVTMLARPLTR